MAKLKQFRPLDWLKRNYLSVLIVAIILAVGAALYIQAHPAETGNTDAPTEYIEY